MKAVDFNSPEVEAGIRRLNSAKVRLPEMPADIELYFGLHGSAEDLDPGLEDSLESADVFALEQVGWAPSTRDLTQRLADGDEEAGETLNVETYGIQKEFWREMHSAILGSHVLIHMPDVPRGHALAVEFERATHEAGVVIGAAAIMGLMPPEKEVQALTGRLFSVYGKREKYILEHFLPKELPEAGHLRIVGFFGVLHKGIANVLGRKVVQEGRDDIKIKVHETAQAHGAYDNFLQQRPNDTDGLKAFLVDQPKNRTAN